MRALRLASRGVGNREIAVTPAASPSARLAPAASLAFGNRPRFHGDSRGLDRRQARFGVGSAIAVVLAICRVPVMPCAIGIYLPVGVNAAILVGGAARYFADRRSTSSAADSPGTLFAAGLVAGEGLCGILLALVALMCR